MPKSWIRLGIPLLALALLAGAVPLHADADPAIVPDSDRVRQWHELAERDDPEALFDLAQAYRFGRGVPADPVRAEALTARAAAMGNTRAADAYGLLLFELGRRQAAMPYLREAARRGDPRAAYLLGIAHFNGDFVEQDWPRAYALMTLARAGGLPQADQALAAMEAAIPAAQRSEVADLVARMRAEAAGVPTSPVASVMPAPGKPTPAPTPSPEPADEGWRIQLGAFSIPANADALWARLAGRPELAGARRLAIPAGRLVLLQAAGFPTRAAAAQACAALKQSGQECLVTRR